MSSFRRGSNLWFCGFFFFFSPTTIAFFDGFFGESGVIVVGGGGDCIVNPISGQEMGKFKR